MFKFAKPSKNFLALVDCSDASFAETSKFPAKVGGGDDCALKIGGADFEFEVSPSKTGALEAKVAQRGEFLINGVEPGRDLNSGALRRSKSARGSSI